MAKIQWTVNGNLAQIVLANIATGNFDAIFNDGELDFLQDNKGYQDYAGVTIEDEDTLSVRTAWSGHSYRFEQLGETIQCEYEGPWNGFLQQNLMFQWLHPQDQDEVVVYSSLSNVPLSAREYVALRKREMPEANLYTPRVGDLTDEEYDFINLFPMLDNLYELENHLDVVEQHKELGFLLGKEKKTGALFALRQSVHFNEMNPGGAWEVKPRIPREYHIVFGMYRDYEHRKQEHSFVVKNYGCVAIAVGDDKNENDALEIINKWFTYESVTPYHHEDRNGNGYNDTTCRKEIAEAGKRPYFFEFTNLVQVKEFDYTLFPFKNGDYVIVE